MEGSAGLTQKARVQPEIPRKFSFVASEVSNRLGAAALQEASEMHILGPASLSTSRDWSGTRSAELPSEVAENGHAIVCLQEGGSGRVPLCPVSRSHAGGWITRSAKPNDIVGLIAADLLREEACGHFNENERESCVRSLLLHGGLEVTLARKINRRKRLAKEILLTRLGYKALLAPSGNGLDDDTKADILSEDVQLLACLMQRVVGNDALLDAED